MKHLLMTWMLIVLAILMAACGGGGSSSEPTLVSTPITLEKPVYTVQRGTIVRMVQLSGRVTPVQQEELYFQAEGLVKEVLVETGDLVEQGDVLMRLDEPEQYLVNVTSAQLTFAQAQANLVEVQLDAPIELAQAYIALEQARRDLQQATQALSALQSTGVSRQLLDLAQYEADLAQGTYNQLAAKVVYWQPENPIGGVALAKLRLAEAEARLALATKELEEIELRAPFAGTVISLGIAPGDSVRPFQIMAVLADPSQLEITALPSSTDFEVMGIGQEVLVRLSSQPDTEHIGKITNLPLNVLSASVDQVIHISLDDQTISLNLGEPITLQVVIDTRENSLWLPPAAIRSFQGQDFVYVESEGVQRRVNVVLGLRADDRVEIVSGLEEGQVVVGQ